MILGPLHPNSEVGSGTRNFTYYLVSNSTSSVRSIHKMGEHRLLGVIMRNKAACMNLLSASLTPRGHSANGSCPADLLPLPLPTHIPLAKPGFGRIMEGNKRHKDQKTHQGPPDGLSPQDGEPRGRLAPGC